MMANGNGERRWRTEGEREREICAGLKFFTGINETKSKQCPRYMLNFPTEFSVGCSVGEISDRIFGRKFDRRNCHNPLPDNWLKLWYLGRKTPTEFVRSENSVANKAFICSD